MPESIHCGLWLRLQREDSKAGETSVYPLRRNAFGDSDSPDRHRTV